ncbi:MAG: MFS transporter [Bacteroidota bacterium]|nr:MAG: MFS transporter [Bacteroidota bacterium]
MKNSPILKLTLLLSAMMTMMAGAVVAPSLPQINQVFAHTPHAALLTRLVITLPALFIAVFSPFIGRLIDRRGRKLWLLASLVIYAISGTSAFFMHSLFHILIGRAVLGIAVAGIMTISTTLVGDYFIGSERSRFMGFQGAFISLGGVFFISLAGILADVSWKTPFLIYLFAVPVLVMASLYLYEPTRHQPEAADKSSRTSTPVTSVNSWLLGVIYLSLFLSIVCFYMVPVQLPFMLHKIEGVSNSMIGYAISVSTLFSAMVSINYHFIRRFLSFPLVLLFAFTLMGLGYYSIAQSTSYFHYLFSLAINGLGVGLLLPTSSLWILEIAPIAMRGRLVSGVSTSMFLGMFFSPILVQPLVNNPSLGFNGAFIAASILLCSMALLIYFGRKVLQHHTLKASTQQQLLEVKQ